MTRDEFTAKHRPSQGCAPDQWEVEDAREKFGRDLDALLAAVRAEALEEAALECDSFATSLDDRNDSDGEWMAEGAIECANRIRAMVSK